MALDLKRYRLTVRQYEDMGRTGILDEDARVELLDGEIVEMTPIGARHYLTVMRVSELFYDTFKGAGRVAVQGPVRLGERSEPQPDVALLRPGIDDLPGVEDVLLLVEVADTTLEKDRQVKMPLYAGAGVREVWLVDLRHDVVEVYRGPSAERYLKVQVARRGEWLAPEALPDRSVAVSDLLPEPEAGAC